MQTHEAILEQSEHFNKMEDTSIQFHSPQQAFIYSLECVQLTTSEISKLNDFQNNKLRKILGKPSTFVDREETNSRMYEELQRDHHCKFEHFGDTWKRTKLRLFGHILRSSPAHPLNPLVFAPGKLVPRSVIKRRVGRPEAIGLLKPTLTHISFCMGPMQSST